MLHYSLRTRAWTLRLHTAISIAAAIAALYLFALKLLTHRSPGLTPEPLAFVQQQETKPAALQFKAALRPLPDHWDIGSPPTLTLDLENDGARPAAFTGNLSISGSCLHSAPGTSVTTSVPAHSTGTLAIPLVATGCDHAPIPQQLLLSLTYTWALQRHTTQSSASPKPKAAQNFQLPGSEAGKSTPLTLNLTIHLPSEGSAPSHASISPPRSYNGTITLAPIEVSNAHERAVRRFYSIITAFAKDFTWPILLALLAFFTQTVLARRGEQQQILQTLLPTMVELMQTYYLPIARRMQRVNIEMESFVTLAPPTAYLSSQPLRRALVAILLMRRQILHLVNNKGGVFFRTRIGEDLFSVGIGAFYSQFMAATGDGDLCEQLALKLTVDDLPHQAEPKVLPPILTPRMRTLVQNFGAWAINSAGPHAGEPSTAFRDYLVLLDLCQAILSFEFDRVFYQISAADAPRFQSWYFDPPAFRFAEDPNKIPAALHAEMLPLYCAYLNQMPAACRKGVRYP